MSVLLCHVNVEILQLQIVKLYETEKTRVDIYREYELTPDDRERYFKASRADHGTKIDMIRNNAHKYSVSIMYDVLEIPKSTYYCQANARKKEERAAEETELSEDIKTDLSRKPKQLRYTKNQSEA